MQKLILCKKKIIAHLKLIIFWLTQLRNDLLVLEISLLKNHVKLCMLELKIFFSHEKENSKSSGYKSWYNQYEFVKIIIVLWTYYVSSTRDKFPKLA